MGKNYKAWEQATEVEVQLLSTTKDWGNKDRKQRHVKDINMVEAISSQQNHWLIIQDKFEDLFTTIT